MQILLPSELFQQTVEMQPIKGNENEDLLSTKTLKFIGQPNPIGQIKSNKKDFTLSEQVM